MADKELLGELVETLIAVEIAKQEAEQKRKLENKKYWAEIIALAND